MEIKQWAPKSLMNFKNKMIPQLQEVLRRFPLDSSDNEFVCRKEKEYRETLQRDIAAQEERKREANVTRDDKLQFVLCFEDDNIRQMYLLSQDVFTRAEIDGRNSEKKEPDFYVQIVEMFNNNKLVMTMEALPDLVFVYALSPNRTRPGYKNPSTSSFFLIFEKLKAK